MRISRSCGRRTGLNLNRRCYANALKARTVDLHVLDGKQQDASAYEKCGGRKNGSFCLCAYDLTNPIFSEAIGEDLFPTC